jgi:hypothetical protein
MNTNRKALQQKMRQRSLRILAQLVCVMLWVLAVNSRRLSETFSPTFDVRDYGVYADGVTDDSTVFSS